LTYKANSVTANDAKTRLEDRDRNNKVRSENDVLLEINVQSVGRELAAENLQGTLNILGPLVDNVVVLGLNKTARGCSHSRAHVCVEETTTWLGSNIIRD
jgi:hypothetical protein